MCVCVCVCVHTPHTFMCVCVCVAWNDQLPKVVIYEALCFDVGQARMNGAPHKTRTHSYRFARASLLTITPLE